VPDIRMTTAIHDERHFARIVSLAADAIICVDKEHRITLFNYGAERTFGYSAHEALGEPIEILIPDRFRAGHGAHVRRFAASAPAARLMGDRGAIHARRKDGSEFPAEATISRTTVNGDPVMTVILRDITPQVMAREQLEKMVAERTRELQQEIRHREDAQEQLVRIQRLEAFGQLTGGVAHDFNNLLTVIGGNLELLKDRMTDERQAKPLNRALDAVSMGARLTQRLLSFARRNRLEPQVLDLNAEVVGIIDMLRRSLGESIDISSVLAPDLWNVRADPSQVENAILNLAINARDAMPGGGRLVIETSNAKVDGAFLKLSSGELLPPGDYVRLSISDTGTGMPPEVLARAFEPFFTTKEPGKGTGLGLASIFGFARQSGGHVTIYSEVGSGTTVNLYLPRSGGASEGAEAARDAAAGAARPAKLRILVVEDNADVRETTIDRLEGLGHAVTACDGASAAMDILGRRSDIDLVFSDVVMAGGLSGLDLAAWMATKKPGIPVLLTSGFTEELLAVSAGAGPKPRLLRKPYATVELAEAIARTLDREER
jgi:PAS domain S-box-containing protein